MSETMSSPSDHWGQFYNHHQQNQNPFVSDATVVTTAVTTTAQNPFVPGAGNLSPEGRVSKPVRRRSRASRRTPTTLLSTDTTNFRAMVQQFTGGPSFSSGSQINAPSFNFALDPRQTQMVPAGFQVQYNHQQQQHQQPSQPSNYMFSLGNNNGNGNGNGDHMFFQRLGNSRPPGMEVPEGLVMDGVSSHVAAAAPPPPRPPSSSSNENRSNTFFF